MSLTRNYQVWNGSRHVDPRDNRELGMHELPSFLKLFFCMETV